ncbi:TrbA [Pantoea sp. AS-PWVM4]|uniref:secretion/conjugation apparatus DotM-related subunit n=1 Tax=Pantoea sp. AS-PWVM4 TaxID=1332069 RepID=UPI0003AC83A4|nr:hypothetical protein [Pantoea sp. AS-PWVM4]ERK16395.1 TrbA [Pantoea sp. AS-PWVM4]
MFIAQLGEPRIHTPSRDPCPGSLLPDFDQFRDHEKSMFAIFGLQHFLGKRKEAKQLLDQLNRSTLKVDRHYRNKIGYPNLSLANQAFHQVATSQAAQAWVGQYSYVRTAIAALHDNDL